MNYLAHLYLSNNDSEIKIGSFIADAVKGSHLEKYPEKIKQGIIIHRYIDSYTDNNLTLQPIRDLLRPTFPKYYGIILDVYCDYFLARNWEKFSSINLRAFVRHFYLNLVMHYSILPPRIKHALPFLISQNWLYSYKETSGLAKIFDRMHKYRGLPWESKEIIADLLKNHEVIEQAFFQFFPEIEKEINNTFYSNIVII